MQRPIKFRGVVINRKAAAGKEADIGDIVTGSLIIYDDGSTPHCWIRRMEKNYADIDYPVDPDSVAQLVGYDKSGREVYEGDTICGSSYRFKAELEPNANIHRFKLKEDVK